VAGHAMDVVKILPPLIIGEKEVEMFVGVRGQSRLFTLESGPIDMSMRDGAPKREVIGGNRYFTPISRLET